MGFYAVFGCILHTDNFFLFELWLIAVIRARAHCASLLSLDHRQIFFVAYVISPPEQGKGIGLTLCCAVHLLKGHRYCSCNIWGWARLSSRRTCDTAAHMRSSSVMR